MIASGRARPSAAERRRRLRRSSASLFAIVTGLAVLSASPAIGDSNLPPAYWSDRQLPDPRQEAEAQALMEQLRCLVCQGQSIADSDAELAGDMRDYVRRHIAAGEKPATIRAWLVERYGSWISYKPTTELSAWPLWVAPLALLLAGLFLIRRRIRLKAG